MSLVIARTTIFAIVILTALPSFAAGKVSDTVIKRSAESFVKAINSKKVDVALKLMGLPFSYRTQDWDNSDQNKGFTLAGAHDSNFTDQKGAKRFLRKLVEEVEIENVKAVKGETSEDKKVEREVYLKGAKGAWSRLELVHFLRGTGDIEHTALVGVDPDSGFVRGFYVN